MKFLDSIEIKKATIVEKNGLDYVVLELRESFSMREHGISEKENYVTFIAECGCGEKWVNEMLPETSYDVASEVLGYTKTVKKTTKLEHRVSIKFRKDRPA